MTEDEIVSRLRDKDVQALGALFEKFSREIYRLAYRILKDHFFAEDISQEVFLKAYERIFHLKETTKLKKWLFKIAVNTAWDLFRQQSRFVPVSQWEEFPLDRFYPSPEDGMIQAEEQAALGQALNLLPPLPFQVVCLYYYHGLSIRQIAQLFHLPESTIKSYLFRARKQIQKFFRGDGSTVHLTKISKTSCNF
ncbi:MAG: RNA polymerase sigma factor [Bacillota bacterium]|nr:RNA polymerase sigma factor [Bacillota bacterium]